MFQIAPKLIWLEKQEEADEYALSTNEPKRSEKVHGLVDGTTTRVDLTNNYYGN